MRKQISTLVGIIIIIVVVAILFGGVFAYQHFAIKMQPTVRSPQTQTAGWKTYTSNNYGFQINYPNNLIDLGQKQFTSYLKGPDSNFTTLKLLQMPGKNKENSESIFGNLQISVATSSDAVANCLIAPANNSEGFGGASDVGNITINGIQFLKYNTSDVGLSNRLAETIYSTVKNNICYRLEIVESGVAFTADANVDKKTANAEAARYGFPFSAYDVFNQLTPIVQTFKFAPTASATTVKASGIIKSVYSKSGKNYLDIDYVILNPNWRPGGNGGPAYTNDNPQIRTFEISKNATILLSGATDVEINYQDFSNIFVSGQYQAGNPWDIIITNGVITQIKEHFLP